MLKSKHLLYLLCCVFFLTKLDISTGLIKVCNFCTVKKKYGLVLQKKSRKGINQYVVVEPFISCNFSRCKKKRDNGWMKDKIDRKDNEKWQFLNANYLLWRHYESHSLKSKRSCCINLYFGNSQITFNNGLEFQ